MNISKDLPTNPVIWFLKFVGVRYVVESKLKSFPIENQSVPMNQQNILYGPETTNPDRRK